MEQTGIRYQSNTYIDRDKGELLGERLSTIIMIVLNLHILKTFIGLERKVHGMEKNL